MTGLADLALRYRILPEYEGIGGELHKAPDATLRALLAAFGVPSADVEAATVAGPSGTLPRLSAPPEARCHMPDWLGEGRVWGVALQLYQIRSSRNQGIGDFTDLADMATLLGAAGADFVGVNPLHALFIANPEHCSPFSPSNRRFLNPLYVAVDRLPEFDPDDIDAEALRATRDTEFVDYRAVAALKLAALRSCWTRAQPDAEALARFRAEGGAQLERHALFEALSLRLKAEGHGPGWTAWPEKYRDPDSPAARAFAVAEAGEVDFHVWLQFLADRQLAAARDAALAAGMRIGLYLDFAVGEAPDGSGTWSDREMVVPGVHVGAPPDYFNAAGQDWGLAPISPVGMATSNAVPFRAMMEDATRRAGALRIDHAMALWQLFLIPEGMSPADGTYVRFPIGDMLRALAQASGTNGTIIIGEDLGNVPPGFRDVMDAAGILSYRILLFERDDEGFIAPRDYPRSALVCLSTHDLPTFLGWWDGHDVELRAEFGLIGAEAAVEQSEIRETERRQLLDDLADAGLLAKDATSESDPAGPALVVAVHRHLARTPSRLFAARLEDMVGEREPVNLPSTVDEYPNWRRKLSLPLEELPGNDLFDAICGALRAERPRGQR